MRNGILMLSVLLFFYIQADAQQPTLVLQKGHLKAINSIRYSSNGNLMVTTSDDGIIKIWDSFSQKLVLELGGNGVKYIDAFFSPDNKTIIASAEQENKGFFTDLANYHNPQRYMLYHKTPLYVWDIASTQLVFSTTNIPQTLGMSPDKAWIVLHADKVITKKDLTKTTTISDAPITISNLGTGKLLRQLTQFKDSSTEAEPLIAFLSDSVLLIATETRVNFHERDIFITKYHLLNFFTGIETREFNDTSNTFKNGSWVLSPSREYLFRYNNQGRHMIDVPNNGREPFTELWNLQKQKLIWSKAVELQSYSFSNNDSLIWIMRQVDPVSNPRDADMLKAVQLILNDSVRMSELPAAYFPDALSTCSNKKGFFATAEMDEHDIKQPADNTYNIDIRHDTIKISTTPCKSKVTAMSFSPDDKLLVTGHEDGNISLWDFTDKLATEIASTGNLIDLVVQLHVGKASDKIWYLTKSMFAMQDANTINKLSIIENGRLPRLDISYLLNEKYSIINLVPAYGSPGSLRIIDNNKFSVVKDVQVAGALGFTHFSAEDKSKSVPSGKNNWRIRLDDPGLESFTLNNTLTKLIKSRLNYTPQEIVMIYGILKGNTGADTMLVSTNYSWDGIHYNPGLKSDVINFFEPYLIPRAKPAATVNPVATSPNSEFLSSPRMSPDGYYMLGRSSAGKYSDQQFLYCQDFKSNFVFKTPVMFGQERVGEVAKFSISPDKKFGCILTNSTLSLGINFIRIINAKNGDPLYNLKLNNGNINGVEYTPDSRYLYSWTEGGTCTKWDLTNGHEVFTMVFFQDHDYAILLPDGYYFISSRTDAKYLNFKINNRLYNFTQFDLQYNRPDKVLEAIGSDNKALMNEYYRAWQRRVKKSGFNENDFNNDKLHVPSVTVNAEDVRAFTDQRQLQLAFTLSDSLFNLKSYNIFINDVPLNGINGKMLPESPGRVSLTQTVLLSEGLNKIEISCTNDNAAASRKEALYVTYTPQKPLHPTTYFIGIGIDNYSAHSSFVDLGYCVKDIRDLSGAFKTKFTGDVVIDTLMNDKASRANILALKEKLMHTTPDDKVILSFSGHGMVDPANADDFYFVTGNTDVNNPAANAVSYAQLEELLDSIPARKKLLLLDACHSGESSGTGNEASNNIPGTKRGNDDKYQHKSGSIEILDVVENSDPSHSSATDVFKLMKGAFVDIRRNNGAYVLSAAQSNESAGEGGGVKNGWFTSCLIEQLKQNVSMRINELSIKVNQCVSAKSSGNQNTDNRQELAEFNWLLW